MSYHKRSLNTWKKSQTTFSLNITSMTDMFTILLVFLLQTYSTSEIQVIPEKGVSLPSSLSQLNPSAALQISLSPEELKFEGRTIASVANNEIKPEFLDNGDRNFITPLFKELDQIIKNSADPKAAEKPIFIQADAKLPYSTLKKIMYTASTAGFAKIKFATVSGE